MVKGGKGALTSNAYPRTAVEGQETPTGPEPVPALRSEAFRVGAEDVSPAMHGVGVPQDRRALADENGVLAFGTAAHRQDSVRRGFASVRWHGRVEAKRCRCLIS